MPGDEALHLRFVAWTRDRVERTMQEHWLAEKPARALVHEQDLRGPPSTDITSVWIGATRSCIMQ